MTHLQSKLVTALTVVTLVATLPGAATAGATLSMKAHGISFITLSNYPMADGSIQQAFTVKYVQENDSGDSAGDRRGGDCAGEGFVTTDGVYSGSYRCTANITADDAYTYFAHDTAEGADFTITGGKGKYKGVTGSGHVTYVWGDSVFGDRIAWESETTMTLP